MKCLLISTVFQNRRIILKLYEPKTNRLILYDGGEYKQYCYVLPDKVPEIREMIGIENIEMVDIGNPVTEDYKEMAKVTVNNPSLIYEMKDMGVAWESDIKLYQSYLYDNLFNVGTWYDVEDGVIMPSDTTQNFDLSKINMESVTDVAEFKKQLETWAKVLGQDIPNIRRMAFDIEVENDGNNLPDPSKGLQRVTAISFHGSDDVKLVYALKRDVDYGEEDKDRDYKIVWYESEKLMLEDAFRLIEAYPLILTYNGDMFDMPYLYNRAVVLGIYHNPFKMMSRKATLNNAVHVDLYGVFSNRSLKLYAFGGKYTEDGLNAVSQSMLGEGKTEYEGSLDEIPLNLLCKYCYNDSRLTYELSHFNNDLVMNLLIILCRIGNMPIDDISRLSISNWIKSMFYAKHREKEELIPRSVDFPKVETTTTAKVKDKKYEGAMVVEPKAGIHFGVTVMDFASLYPSIIKTRNISYETVCCPHEECKTNKIPYTDHWCCTKKIGMASLLIGSLKELRVNHYKVLSKTAKTEQERDINDTIAQALKVFLNASYGVIGADIFPLYFLPTAEAVTAIGRDIISQTIETAKAESLPVLYGDTDSIFVLKPTEEQVKKLIDFCHSNYAIDLEVDKEYKYLVLSNRKKNYFGVKTNGKLDIKGLSGKKSNTPPFVKRLFYDVLEKLQDINDKDEFEEAKLEVRYLIQVVVDNFDKIPLKELSFKVMVSKDPSEYKVKPQVVKAGEQLGKVEKGQFVEFIKTWNDLKVKPIQLAKRDDVDKAKYLESLESVMQQITEPMGISMDLILGRGEQTTLGDF